jgi:DNA/RNA endonuclease G (NUC1)
MHERNLVTEKRPELFIVSGPLYEQDWGAIGPNEDIAVPTAFYKVILSKQVGSDPGVQNSELPLAVIVPNTLSNGQNPKENRDKLCEEFTDENLGQGEGPRDDWKPYLTTIEEVERRAGIDIPDVAETVRIGE